MSRHQKIRCQSDKMEELKELEEYCCFLDFLSNVDVDDDSEQYYISDIESIDDVCDDENLMEVEEFGEADSDIIQCIVDMIEIEFSLQKHIPKERRKGQRRWGVHPLNQMRLEHGHFDNLFREMLAFDHEKFFNYTRMTPERFQHLYELIEPKITKSAPNAIPAKCRLLLTLRFLAVGDSLKSLHYNFRVGVSTARNMIAETCDALWEVLQPIYMKFPEKEDWLKIEKDFREKLNFPHCVGALDGKLIEIFAPKHSGSLYFNYNKYFSENLLALCDAHKSFTYVDIGSFGQQTDGGILFNSSFGKRLDMKKLNFPEPDHLPLTNVPFPYFIIADSAFPLKENLLTPYSGDHLNMSDVESNFNQEQTSARKIIENTFAILVRRWQVFNGPIEMHPKIVDKVVKAATVLHNYIKSFDDPASTRYMREERFTYPTTASLRSFYESGLELKNAKENEYASAARNTLFMKMSKLDVESYH